MAYDAGLLDRCLDALRELRAEPIRHKNVFGMRGLLKDRRMFAAVGEQSVVILLGVDEYESAVRRRGVRPFMPGGSSLGRWVEVEERVVADDPELREWLSAGLRSLG